MKHLLLSALTIAALSSPSFAEERQVEIAVSELTSVEIAAFEDGPEYGQGVYSVTYDDTETTIEGIIGAVTANGYPAQVLPDAAS